LGVRHSPDDGSLVFAGTMALILHLFGVRIEVGFAATLIFQAFSFCLPMLPALWLTHRENRSES
jgi:uncharacterized membrane protein YbhN (UPF0104 family)